MNAIKCKSVLTKSKLPKVDYCYNVYIGCTHSCKYCYAEFMKKFTGHINEEWGKFLDYKENAVDILKKEIRKIKADKWVLMGSVTDTYQPIEKKLLLTRRSLEVFLEYKVPVSILTKSDLVMRDIDILMKFPNCEVGVSCAFSDNKISSVIEPNASSLDKRVITLRELKRSGIKTYAFIGPIIPELTKLEDVFELIASSVDFVMGEALNLRCGNLDKLRKGISELVGEPQADKIISICRSKEYWTVIENKFNELCKKYNIESRGFFVHNIQSQ